MTTPNDTQDGGEKNTIERLQKRLEQHWESNKQKKPLSENSGVEEQMSEYCAHLFEACCVNGYANR